jgi:maltose O-acetyltransferase
MAKPFFKKCGRKLGLGRRVVFYQPAEIEIGNWVYIAYGCWFSCGFGVTIEDEVMFGPYNIVATSDHTIENGSFRFGKPKGDRIIFKKGCWVGAHCTILKGTIVGEGSVIGANSVVSGNIPGNCLYGGNPGVIKKRLDD